MSIPISADEQPAVEETYDSVPHLTVADGFRLGCGLILSLVAFGFILVILAATGVLLAMVLGLPLPFGIP
jgi:hypothetical protein